MGKKILIIGLAGVLSLGVLTGCDNEEDKEVTKQTDQVEETTTEDKEVEGITDEEKIEKAKEETGMNYIVAKSKVITTIQVSQSEIMKLASNNSGLSDSQWLEGMKDVGIKIQEATDMMNETENVPEGYEESSKIFKSAVKDFDFFANNAQEAEGFLESGGTKDQIFTQLITGMKKMKEANDIQAEKNEQKQ